jgi:hypothetical protein
MSQEADPMFKEHLTKCLDKLFADPLLEGECHLHADASVKSVSRMEVKVLEYRAAGETPFCASLVGDPLRATVVCTNSHVMVKALEAVGTES